MQESLQEQNNQLKLAEKQSEQRKLIRIHSTESIFKIQLQSSPLQNPRERRNQDSYMKSYQNKVRSETNSPTKILEAVKKTSRTPTYKKFRTASGSLIYQSDFSIPDIKKMADLQKEIENSSINKSQKPLSSLSGSKPRAKEQTNQQSTATTFFSSKSTHLSSSALKDSDNKTGFNSCANSDVENNIDGLANGSNNGTSRTQTCHARANSSAHFLFRPSSLDNVLRSPINQSTNKSKSQKKAPKISIKFKNLGFLKTAPPLSDDLPSERRLAENTTAKRKSLDLKEGRLDFMTGKIPMPIPEFLQSILSKSENNRRSKAGTSQQPFCLANPRLNQRIQPEYPGSYKSQSQKFTIKINDDVQQPMIGTRATTHQERLNTYMSKFDAKRIFSLKTPESKGPLTTESDKFSVVFSKVFISYAKKMQLKQCKQKNIEEEGQ